MVRYLCKCFMLGLGHLLLTGYVRHKRTVIAGDMMMVAMGQSVAGEGVVRVNSFNNVFFSKEFYVSVYRHFVTVGVFS